MSWKEIAGNKFVNSSLQRHPDCNISNDSTYSCVLPSTLRLVKYQRNHLTLTIEGKIICRSRRDDRINCYDTTHRKKDSVST